MITLNTTVDRQPRGLTLAEMISEGVYKLVLWVERMINRR